MKKSKPGKTKSRWKKFLEKLKPSIPSSEWDRIITEAVKEYLAEFKQMTDKEQLREFKSFLKTFAKNGSSRGNGVSRKKLRQ